MTQDTNSNNNHVKLRMEKSKTTRIKKVELLINKEGKKLPEDGFITKSQLVKRGFKPRTIDCWEGRGKITNVNTDPYSGKMYECREVKFFFMNWGKTRGYPKGRPRK